MTGEVHTFRDLLRYVRHAKIRAVILLVALAACVALPAIAAILILS